MTREEETYFLRLMQVADKATLDEHFILKENNQNKDGTTTLTYDVTYPPDAGYLTITYIPEPRELRMAEMNVGFQTMIGLNRSPLELRILVEHVLDVYGL
ncbi:MAG: hypothetical protein Q4C56_10025 [Peptococcaceae bacterium]|nr:hypothetical protein [Peptococcaceae bacterium]